jgi:hypothetical protein
MGRKIVEVVGKMSAVKGAHLFILPVKNVSKELKEDGTLTKLSKKWFGQDTAP